MLVCSAAWKVHAERGGRGAVPDDFGDLVVFGEMRFVFHSGTLGFWWGVL